MECEICGMDRYTRPVEKEGAKLYLCSDCGGYARPNFTKPGFKPNTGYRNRPSFNNRPYSGPPRDDRPRFDPNLVKDLVEDYGVKIGQARQKANLKIEELARELFISASYLQKIEGGKFKPDNMTAKKLEKRLNIVLFETPKKEEEAKELPKPIIAEEKKE